MAPMLPPYCCAPYICRAVSAVPMRVRLLILCCCMYVGAPAAAAVAMLWRRSGALHTRRYRYRPQRRRYPRPEARCVAQTVQSSARGAVLSAAAAVAEPPPPAPPAQTATTAASQALRRRRAMDGLTGRVRCRLRRWCIGAERRRRSRAALSTTTTGTSSSNVPVRHCTSMCSIKLYVRLYLQLYAHIAAAY